MIGNVLDDFSISDGISGYDILLNYPGQIPTVLPNPDDGTIGLEPAYTLPHEDSPYDDNITFSETPVIAITPKIKDGDGNYVPAGPAVYCDLSRPTPGHTIILDDMTGVTPGDELIINNTKIKYKDFNEAVKPDGINLDYDIDPVWAKENLLNVVLQGGLSPKVLLLSDQEMINSAKPICARALP